MKKAYLLIMFLLLIGCTGIQYMEFVPRDIKNDFCGPVMEPKYCKCAFHNNLCSEAGMTQKEAKDYVEEEFERWERQELEKFRMECVAQKDRWFDKDKCNWCDEGYVYDGHVCEKPENLWNTD